MQPALGISPYKSTRAAAWNSTSEGSRCSRVADARSGEAPFDRLPEQVLPTITSRGELRTAQARDIQHGSEGLLPIPQPLTPLYDSLHIARRPNIRAPSAAPRCAAHDWTGRSEGDCPVFAVPRSHAEPGTSSPCQGYQQTIRSTSPACRSPAEIEVDLARVEQVADAARGGHDAMNAPPLYRIDLTPLVFAACGFRERRRGTGWAGFVQEATPKGLNVAGVNGSIFSR